MRSGILAGFILAAAAGWVGAAGPRERVERAVQAQGGLEKLGQIGAFASKNKGVIYGAGGARNPCSIEVYAQWPDRFKWIYTIEVEGRPHQVTMALSGGQGWVWIHEEKVRPMDAQTRKETEVSAYVSRVAQLVPLLKDNQYQLSDAGPATVEGHPADGVLVRAAGRPDVRLYFDRASGLLVKQEYRAVDSVLDDRAAEARFEIFFRDYRTADPAAADEALLKTYHIPSDGPALLDYLRKHSLAGAEQESIPALVKRLGDRSFMARERAAAALVARGQAAVPALREASQSPDSEVASRAARCLKQIGATGAGVDEGSAAVAAAVVRLVGLRKPEGAAEVLRAYLSAAPDENVAHEARYALAAVTAHGGKADPGVEDLLAGERRQPVPRRLLLEGVKYPARVAALSDGRKSYDYEVLEVRYFTRLAPHLFDRP